MRKSMWIILTVLFVGIGAPNAHADSTPYTIDFTVNPSNHTLIQPSADTITYDTVTGSFSPFTVNWNGNSFSLPQFFVGNPSTDSFKWFADVTFSFIETAITFEVADLTDRTGVSSDTISLPPPNDPQSCENLPPCGEDGTFTLTPVPATPEPATGGLMLLGTGFVLAMRKRIAKRNLRAAGTAHSRG